MIVEALVKSWNRCATMRTRFDFPWRSYPFIFPRSNIGANFRSSTIIVVHIGYHWWYDQRLSTYYHGLVVLTDINGIDRTMVHVCIVSLLFRKIKILKDFGRFWNTWCISHIISVRYFQEMLPKLSTVTS